MSKANENLIAEILWAISVLESALRAQWKAENDVRTARIQLSRKLECAQAKPVDPSSLPLVYREVFMHDVPPDLGRVVDAVRMSVPHAFVEVRAPSSPEDRRHDRGRK